VYSQIWCLYEKNNNWIQAKSTRYRHERLESWTPVSWLSERQGRETFWPLTTDMTSLRISLSCQINNSFDKATIILKRKALT
jgi:hypothetical protein